MRLTLPPDWSPRPAADPPPTPAEEQPPGRSAKAATASAPEGRAAAVRHPVAWWTAPRADGTSSPQASFTAGAKPVSEIMDSAGKWLALLLPVYLTIRILGFAGFQSTLALEIVRQQGISGIAEAALASLFTEIAGLVVVGGLVLLLRVGSRSQERVVGLVLAGVAAAFAPLLIVGLGLFMLLLMWAGSRRGAVVGAVLLALGTVTVPAVSSPWLPREIITSPEFLTTAGGGACYVDGYVLGRASGTFYSVLQEPAGSASRNLSPECPADGEPAGRNVHLIPELTTRTICESSSSGWRAVLEASFVDRFSADLAPCEPPDVPAPAAQVVRPGLALTRLPARLPPSPTAPDRVEAGGPR